MHRILSVSLGSSDLDYSFETRFLGKKMRIERRGVNGDLRAAGKLVADSDGRYDVIGLGGMGLRFRVGGTDWIHHETHSLARRVTRSALTDGRRVKTTLGKWAVRDTNRRFDGLFSNAAVLFLSGINYYDISKVVSEYTDRLKFADPVVHFGLPYTLGSHRELEWYARGSMPVLTRYSYKSFFPARTFKDEWRHVLLTRAVDEAEVIVGDQLAIRHYTPYHLRNKILVTDSVDELFLDEMRSRGVRMIVSILPRLADRPVNDNVLEGMIVCALGKDPNAISDDDFLGLFERIELQPDVTYPQGEPVRLHKFAFVIHPLARRYLYKHPALRWVESAPGLVQAGVEKAFAHSPAFVYSKVTGIKSPTGDEAEGYLIALGATPAEMVSRSPEFTYGRLVAASRAAKKLGARMMGLGAFTKVVGDAGITVAKRADLPITSGNSYTASATLWAAKEASVRMGLETDARGRADGKAMVVGATGSIGSVSARLLALAFPELVLVAPRADKLLELKQEIEAQSPDCDVTVTTRADAHLSDVDLIVTTTSARGAKVLDMMRVKPGAVICDCARPLDIGPEEAKKRPDVMVVESGEIELPGDVDFGGDIGLPPKVAYACLAETVVLALEGRYENFTLGRNIQIDRVKEIYKLGLKHGCKLAAIRGPFGVYTEEMIAEIRRRADQARRNWRPPSRSAAAATPESEPVRRRSAVATKKRAGKSNEEPKAAQRPGGAKKGVGSPGKMPSPKRAAGSKKKSGTAKKTATTATTNGSSNGRSPADPVALMRRLRSRFRKQAVERETSFLVSLGDDPGHVWTFVLSPSRCSIRKGRRVEVADCELTTSADLLQRMLLEGYAPVPGDFEGGRLTTEKPEMLAALRAGFGADGPRGKARRP